MKSTKTYLKFMELTESQEASFSGGSTKANSITVNQTKGNVSIKISQAQSVTTKTSTSTVSVSNSKKLDTKAFEKEMRALEEDLDSILSELDFDW